MPYLFKLSQRVARLRARAVLVATAAVLGACEATGPSLSAPTHPSFATSTGAPAGVNMNGITLLGPTLMHWGTEEQKKRFLPKILPAEEICLD